MKNLRRIGHDMAWIFPFPDIPRAAIRAAKASSIISLQLPDSIQSNLQDSFGVRHSDRCRETEIQRAID
jgi:hypothetical protein